MKNIFVKIALPVVIGLLANQVTLAHSKTAPHSFGHGGGRDIHVTTIHTSGDSVYAEAVLYLGTNSNGSCGKLSYVASASGDYLDGYHISVASELFDGQPLDNNSCALEEWTVTSGKVITTDYKLINDGTEVTAANPAESEITLPANKKK